VGATGSPDTADRVPSAWWSGDGRTWQRAEVPRPPGSAAGTMSGLVAVGERLVAVGWVGSGDTTEAAAWVSDDGKVWRAGSVDDAGASSMHDVIARPRGLLAVGVDTSADREGDGAVWASPDGTAWRRVDITGVDGLGAQTLDRVVSSGGNLLAVGQEPEGAGTVARVRQSVDGSGWAEVDTDLPAGSEVSGLTRLPDARLAAAGSVSIAGRRQPRVWLVDAAGRTWEPQALADAGRAGRRVDILGVAAAGGSAADGLVAVGSLGDGIDGGDGPAPASWSLTVNQPR
jgi:hypothetical protein